jgi:hypothetical protein
VLTTFAFVDVNNSLTATGATAARQRKEKLPFVIDFETPSTVSSKKLFEPGTKTAISLPAVKTKKRKIGINGKKGKKAKEEEEEEERDEHLLPDDMHFSSRQLLRLFLKPKFTVSDWIYLNEAEYKADLRFNQLKMRRQGAVAKQIEEGLLLPRVLPRVSHNNEESLTLISVQDIMRI